MNITIRGVELPPITWADWENPASFAGGPTWSAGDFHAGRSPSSAFFVHGRNGRPHLGIDTGNGEQDYGKFIGAGAEGVVAARSFTYLSGAGRWVKVGHNVEGHVTYSYYMHLSSISVSVGDRVSQGQIVGKMGGSGYGRNRYYSPHLHTEIFHYLLNPSRNGSDRVHIDPELIYFDSPSNKKGWPRSMSSDVKELQGTLNSLGESLSVDGSYGPMTHDANMRHVGETTTPEPVVGIPEGSYVGVSADGQTDTTIELKIL